MKISASPFSEAYCENEMGKNESPHQGIRELCGIPSHVCTCVLARVHTKALYKLLSTILVLTWANQAARVASVKHTSGCVALSSATLEWLPLFKDRLGDLTLQPPLQFWPTGPQDLTPT